MKPKKAAIYFYVVFCLYIGVPQVSADTLIFNNSNPVSTWFTGSELLDYGTSPGGTVAKFVFGYTSYAPGATARVRFYAYTNNYHPGFLIKEFVLTNLPKSTSNLTVQEYVIREEDKFILPGGNFGYSIQYSLAPVYAPLTSGGTGVDQFYWTPSYDGDFIAQSIGATLNPYFKIYAAPRDHQGTSDIQGYVFYDCNDSGVREQTELAVCGWKVYLDLNGDGAWQASEPNAVTDANGYYAFMDLPAPATYRVRQVIGEGWTQTHPGAAEYVVNASANQVYSPCYFGNRHSAKYGGGQGTSAEPYRLYTPDHLNQIGFNRADWDKHYILMADLDMSGQRYNCIGTVNDGFRATFNGNGHVIRNVSYSAVAKSWVGLFGYCTNAQIFHVGLENVTVSSRGECIAGLAGYISGGSITNCHVTGQVSGGDGSWYVGLLAGEQSGGSVSNCHVRGQVSGGNGSQYVGGLAGRQFNLPVNDCRSAAAVSSGNSSSYVGGFAGRAGNLTSCYSVGAVTAGTRSTSVGGLAGDGGSIISCYWDSETSGIAYGMIGSPRTTAQMQTQSNYTGWDFVNTWRICEGINYPLLRLQVPRGDFVCPDGIGLKDVFMMADAWLATGEPAVDIAPATSDGIVNLADFAALSANWMTGSD